MEMVIMILPIQFNDEIYKDITIDGVQPYYQVSNYGVVINKITGRQLSQAIMDCGYARVRLAMKDGSSKSLLVHRLVMLTFDPIENPDLFQVNHKHGVKLDNRYGELEWCTPQENVQHAIRTGLMNNSGENNERSVLTLQEAHIICQGLSRGDPFDIIAKSVSNTSVKDIIREIRAIKDREIWTSVSSMYIFPEYPNRRNKFTDKEVHLICQMLESGAGYRDVLIALGYNIDQMSTIELQNMCDIIGDIRLGGRYKNISAQYDVSYTNVMRTDQIFDFDQIRYICECFQNNMGYSDILTSLGITKESVGLKQYDAYKHTLYRIRGRKQFTNISDGYIF